jgi:hypothetical protein
MDATFDIIRFIARKVFCLVMESTCSTLIGITIPKGMGATWSASNLQDPRGLVVDLVEAVNLSLTEEQTNRLNKAKETNQQSTYDSIFYPIAKQYVLNLRKSFKNKRLVLICSDHSLLKYCGVKEMHYFVPSNNFLTAVIDQAEDRAKELIRKSVVNILMDKGNKAQVFANFEQLTAFLRDIGLVAKI